MTRHTPTKGKQEEEQGIGCNTDPSLARLRRMLGRGDAVGVVTVVELSCDGRCVSLGVP